MDRRLLLSILHRLGLPLFLRFFKRNRITILNLHRITHERDYFFEPVTPERFEALVKYALKHYTIVSFSELGQLKKTPVKPPLLFSFDDGYYDFYEFALPILKKYKVPSNHNIVNECANNNRPIWTHRLNAMFNHCRLNSIAVDFEIRDRTINANDCENDWQAFYLAVFRELLTLEKTQRTQILGDKEHELSVEVSARMMGWDEIVECTKNGVEIGSHTYTHDVISTVSTAETLESEILSSKQEIEEKIGQPVSILALPNGQGNQFVNDFVRSAGFRYLLYVNDAVNRIAPGADEELRIMERVNIADESYGEMVLRTELFHARARKYVGLLNKKA